MTAKEKTSILILILLLLFTFSSNSGIRDGVKDVLKPSKLQTKTAIVLKDAIIRVKARKLIGLNNAMLDYYEGGANPAHEPGKGKSGGRGGNNP